MKKTTLLLISSATLMALAACSDDNNTAGVIQPSDDIFVGLPVGNFTAEEWYPGGELGTTDNVSSASYEDETPAVTMMGKSANFKSGELFFERNFVEKLSQSTPFRGLGPAWVRTSCIQCHPGYGHGKRVNTYEANSTIGNGYLLVVYHPTAGVDAAGNAYAKDSYVTELTGMPQTKAASPFLPPVDESGISIAWLKATDGALPNTFPDGETYELIYPEVTIAPDAFNTNPRPTNYEVRIESTIGIYGTGLLDAISEDDLKAQYQAEAPYVSLNPAMWDAAANDWAASDLLFSGRREMGRWLRSQRRKGHQTLHLRPNTRLTARWCRSQRNMEHHQRHTRRPHQTLHHTGLGQCHGRKCRSHRQNQPRPIVALLCRRHTRRHS